MDELGQFQRRCFFDEAQVGTILHHCERTRPAQILFVLTHYWPSELLRISIL